MSTGRQALAGVLAALLSIAILIGSLSLTLAESGIQLALGFTATATEASQPPTQPPVTLSPGAPTFTPLPSPTPTASATLPMPTACPPPAGWVPVVVQLDDTLDGLALRYGTTPEELLRGNCLLVASLQAGSILYVPPPAFTATPAQIIPSPTPVQPTATQRPANTRVACGHPYGWVLYRVQSGDTLSSIGRLFGVTAYQLQVANCMGSSTLIRTGQLLYVPNVPMRTPTFTPSPQPTRTPVLTSTSTVQPPPSSTPTQVIPPTATGTIPATNTPAPPEPTPTLPPLPATLPPIVTPVQTPGSVYWGGLWMRLKAELEYAGDILKLN